MNEVPMTVAVLMAYLENLPGDMPILMARDIEGDTVDLLATYGTAVFAYDAMPFDRPGALLLPDDRQDEGMPCVVLYP